MTTDSSSIHPDGVQMHIGIRPGDIPSTVLMPGDPFRVPVIGESWDDYRELAFRREFRSARGTLDGVEIGACSHGVGGPSTDIAMVELANCGADTFIRVGTCAALQPEISAGDLIIASGALRLTGTVDAYIDRSYPAVASHDVVMALIQAAEELGEAYHVGLSASVDSFYAGEVNPMPGGYRQSRMDTVIEDLTRARVANFEMEAATMFTLAGLFGYRAGMICATAVNRNTGERADKDDAIRRTCKVASRAVVILSGWDRTRREKGKAHFFPGLLG